MADSRAAARRIDDQAAWPRSLDLVDELGALLRIVTMASVLIQPSLNLT